MTNNDIFKKLRVALQLRDDEIVEILELVDFRISKSELNSFFRSEDHPSYKECGDQILRNFLNALVIHLRGTKEEPKNPKEVIEYKKTMLAHAKALAPKKENDATQKSSSFKPKSNTSKPKGNFVKKDAKPSIGNIKFNNGKKKKD